MGHTLGNSQDGRNLGWLPRASSTHTRETGGRCPEGPRAPHPIAPAPLWKGAPEAGWGRAAQRDQRSTWKFLDRGVPSGQEPMESVLSLLGPGPGPEREAQAAMVVTWGWPPRGLSLSPPPISFREQSQAESLSANPSSAG